MLDTIRDWVLQLNETSCADDGNKPTVAWNRDGEKRGK